MSAPVVGITTRDGRLAVTFTRAGKLEGWAYFDELSYEARDTFLAALEIQKKDKRGKIDLGKIAQELPQNDPFSRTRCRAVARVAMARLLGLKAECVQSGSDGHPHLVVEVPETIPQDKRIQDWLTVHFVGVEAEKQIYGSYTGDGNGEIEELAKQFHLDKNHSPHVSAGPGEQQKASHSVEVDVKKMTEELQSRAAWVRENKEAALNEPYHLFFFSAVDRNGITRFFDIMKQDNGFSLAETATSTARLGQCIETIYADPEGGTHHVHRNYGEYRTATARQAMQHFASVKGLVQLTEIAETRNQLEATPMWKRIFENLGCATIAFSPKSVSDHRTEVEQRRNEMSLDEIGQELANKSKQLPKEEPKIAFERLMNYASTPVGGIRDKQGQGAQNGRILVVHHERVIAEVICKILAHEGYDARMECSSSEAIAKALQWMPQLLIIDPVMPGVSGVVAAKEVCGQIECKVLLINAAAREPEFAEVVNNLRNKGCDCEAFPLPFEKADLLEHVRQRVGPAPKVARTDPTPLYTRGPSPSAKPIDQQSTSTSEKHLTPEYRTHNWKRYSSAHGAFLRCITFGVRKDLPEDHPDQPLMRYQRRCEEVDRIVAKKGCPDEEDLRRWVEEDREYDERANLLEKTKASSDAPAVSVSTNPGARPVADPPRCSECGALSEKELCSKCEGEAFLLAHRQRPQAESPNGRPDSPNGTSKATPGRAPKTDLAEPKANGEAAKMSKKHAAVKEFVRGVPMEEYRKENPLTPEQLEENRMGLLKEFAPELYEKAVKQQAEAQAMAKNPASTLISLQTIDALLKSANAVTRIEENSLMFKGFIGETRIEISPSGLRTGDGLEVSEIIRIESLLEKVPVTWDDGLLCAVNMVASNGALTVDADGKLRIKSRISLFSGEPREVLDVYIGIIFLGAMIHTNAVQAYLVDAWRLPVSKGAPPPDSSVDGVWKPASFARAASMLREAGVFSNGDKDGLTAEFAWDPGAVSAVENLLKRSQKRTSLLRISCEEHPSLGKGLFCRLELPLNLSDAEAFKLAIKLNEMESAAQDWPPFLGAWTSKPKSGRPTFVSFWPNFLSKAISLELITSWHAARAKRIPQWVLNTVGAN
jgi:CheY-like chemotaxis protein